MRFLRHATRIVWMLRLLIVLGLIAMATTIGLMGLSLVRVRDQRAQAMTEQVRLKNASDALREQEVRSSDEIQELLDAHDGKAVLKPTAVRQLTSSTTQLASTETDSGVREALQELKQRVAIQARLADRAESWRTNYDLLAADVDGHVTLRRVREVIAKLRNIVDTLEGRRRLAEAIKYRAWRNAGELVAEEKAREIIDKQAWMQSHHSMDFRNELAECARLVELLGGEEHGDSLADLKDNKLKPVLDQMSRSIAAFGEGELGDESAAELLIEELQENLFGRGYVVDNEHQDVRPGAGGLFTLRRDVLRLRDEREALKKELSENVQSIDLANSHFAQSTDSRIAALAKGMEDNLAAMWHRLMAFGTVSSGLFVWLAWLIARGIGNQVNELELSRANAEEARRTSERLMLEQQEAAAELRKLSRAVEQSPASTVITDKLGNIEYVNPKFTELTGYSPAEVLGKNPRLLKSANTARETYQELWTTIAAGGTWAGEFLNRKKNGDLFWERAVISPVLNSQDQITHYIAVKEDITRRKRTEALLSGERQVLELMAAGEDLHTVLAAIANNVESISDGALCSVLLLDVNGLNLRHAAAPSLPAEYSQAIDGVEIGPQVGSCGTAAFLRETVIVHEIASDILWSNFRDLALKFDLKSCWSKPIFASDGSVLGTFATYRRKPSSPTSEELDVVERAANQAGIAIERNRAVIELEKAQQDLVASSRQAGMAEVATGVLHNVGNVLNSVNVSATLIRDRLQRTRTAAFAKIATLLKEQSGDLPGFFAIDPRGAQLPGYLEQFAAHLKTEQAELVAETDNLRKNIEHIKDIVAMQQSHAKQIGLKELVDPATLIDDALRLNADSLERQSIAVAREFEPLPPVEVDKHKVLQILVNFLRNARHACEDSGSHDKKIVLGLRKHDNQLLISVTDNGVGILTENQTRIFHHGFTTRENGHVFGLHSGANAAREMGGRISVQSAGPGEGATFTLELPFVTNSSQGSEGEPSKTENISELCIV